MTTQEKLLAEAREWYRTSPRVTEIIAAKNHGAMSGKPDPGFNATDVIEIVAAAQAETLRAAKESGHLRHADRCEKWEMIGPSKLLSRTTPCSCGFADRYGEL